MFGRSNFAIFGVERDTMDAFQKTLSSPFTSFEVSQLAAAITTKFKGQPTVGINPFGTPRVDEKLTDAATISRISEYLLAVENGDNLDQYASLREPFNEYVGIEDDFSLGNSKYGFWVVFNEYEDPTHPASKKEQLSYVDRERPFKFLPKEEKKAVEDQVTATAILNRSQFEVMVDFQNARVYASTTNKNEVSSVQDLLTKMGVKVKPLVWDFKYPTWPGEFLNCVVRDTHYSTDMQKRAEELARFRADEVEPLDDKQVERIVSNYFALAPLETELWAALKTPARIRIHKPIDPVGVSNPSVAFSLLAMSDDAEVASAPVVFQELAIRNTKDGEKTIRKDVFVIDINDNMNLQDVGSAILKGFDLPQFKRNVKVALKAKGRMTIRDYWAMWLDGMNNAILELIDNITSVLDVDKGKYGLVVPDYEISSADEEEYV